MAVAFQMMCVKFPDKDNWGKLKQVLKYLNGMRSLKLTINVNDLGILKCYVDGSQGLHWDCKGHEGAIFTLGEGAVSSYSRKLELITCSSTETELVVANMYLPKVIYGASKA